MSQAANPYLALDDYGLRNLIRHLAAGGLEEDALRHLSPGLMQAQQERLGTRTPFLTDCDRVSRIALGRGSEGLLDLCRAVALHAAARLPDQLVLPSTLALRAALGELESAVAALPQLTQPAVRVLAHAHLGHELAARSERRARQLLATGYQELATLEDVFGLSYACRALAVLQVVYGGSEEERERLLAAVERGVAAVEATRVSGPDSRWLLAAAIEILMEGGSRGRPGRAVPLFRREHSWSGSGFFRSLTRSWGRPSPPREDRALLRWAQRIFVARCGMSRDGNHYDTEPTAQARAAMARSSARRRSSGCGTPLERELLACGRMVELLLAQSGFVDQSVLESEEAALDLADRISWWGLARAAAAPLLAEKAARTSLGIVACVERRTHRFYDRQRLRLLLGTLVELVASDPAGAWSSLAAASAQIDLHDWRAVTMVCSAAGALLAQAKASAEDALRAVAGNFARAHPELSRWSLEQLALVCRERLPRFAEQLDSGSPGKRPPADFALKQMRHEALVTHIHATPFAYYACLPALQPREQPELDTEAEAIDQLTDSERLRRAQSLLLAAMERGIASVYGGAGTLFDLMRRDADQSSLGRFARDLLELPRVTRTSGEDGAASPTQGILERARIQLSWAHYVAVFFLVFAGVVALGMAGLGGLVFLVASAVVGPRRLGGPAVPVIAALCVAAAVAAFWLVARPSPEPARVLLDRLRGRAGKRRGGEHGWDL